LNYRTAATAAEQHRQWLLQQHQHPSAATNIRLMAAQTNAPPAAKEPVKVPKPPPNKTSAKTKTTKKPTKVPVKSTKVPVKPTKVPVEIVKIPVKIAKVPVKPTKVPVKSVKAPSRKKKPARPKLPTAAIPRVVATTTAPIYTTPTTTTTITPTTTTARAHPPLPNTTPTTKKARKPHIFIRDVSWAVLDQLYKSPVVCASKYVGNELEHGMWPSPFMSGEVQKEHAHKQHMKVVAATLNDFARRVLLPTLQQPGVDQEEPISLQHLRRPTSGKPPPRTLPQAFFATLLALREVMTQNAERIFGKDCLEDAEDDGDASSSHRKRRRGVMNQEERMYLARTLATGVSIAAIERCLPAHADRMVENFLEMVSAYDNGDDDFTVPTRTNLDNNVVQCVLPNGKRLQPEEQVAQSVSFDQARKQHPLTQQQLERTWNNNYHKSKKQLMIRVPNVTACHISMVEMISDWAQRHP
jgi:hypothetical protein